MTTQFVSLEDRKRPEKKELICCHHRNDPSFCLWCCRPLKCNITCITVHFLYVWRVAVGLALQHFACYAAVPQSHRSRRDGGEKPGHEGQLAGVGSHLALPQSCPPWTSCWRPVGDQGCGTQEPRCFPLGGNCGGIHTGRDPGEPVFQMMKLRGSRLRPEPPGVEARRVPGAPGLGGEASGLLRRQQDRKSVRY